MQNKNVKKLIEKSCRLCTSWIWILHSRRCLWKHKSLWRPAGYPQRRFWPGNRCMQRCARIRSQSWAADKFWRQPIRNIQQHNPQWFCWGCDFSLLGDASKSLAYELTPQFWRPSKCALSWIFAAPWLRGAPLHLHPRECCLSATRTPIPTHTQDFTVKSRFLAAFENKRSAAVLISALALNAPDTNGSPGTTTASSWKNRTKNRWETGASSGAPLWGRRHRSPRRLLCPWKGWASSPPVAAGAHTHDPTIIWGVMSVEGMESLLCGWTVWARYCDPQDTDISS